VLLVSGAAADVEVVSTTVVSLASEHPAKISSKAEKTASAVSVIFFILGLLSSGKSHQQESDARTLAVT